MHRFRHFIDGDARNWCTRRRVVWRFTRGLHGRLVLVRLGLWSFNFSALKYFNYSSMVWYTIMVYWNPFTFDKCSFFIIFSCISLLMFAVFFKQISEFNIKLVNFDHFDPTKNSSTAEPRPWAGRRARWFETAIDGQTELRPRPWNRRVFYIARLIFF